MHIITPVVVLLAATSLAACSSAEKRAHKAEAEYAEEKTEILKDYRRCVDDSNGEEAELKKCESLLKAVEAIEGGGSK